MSIRHWCRTIAKLPRGRVLIRNLLYDIERRRIPRDLFEELIEHVRSGFDNSLPAESATDLVDNFRDAGRPHRACSGQGGPAQPEACSRVIDEGSCFNYNIRPDHYGLPKEDEPPTWFFEEVARRPLDPKGIRDQMNTGRGYVWVTRRQALEQEISSGASAADAARRGLGLHHIQSGMRLLAIHYPEGEPWSVKNGPPTAIEGGANAVYRSTAGEDGWGRAVDLDTLEDGLPELIHEPVDFTQDFTLEVLGPVLEGDRPSAHELADATAPLHEDWLEQTIIRLVEHAESPPDERPRQAQL